MRYRLNVWYEQVHGYTDDVCFVYVTEMNRNHVKYDSIILNDTSHNPYTYERDLVLDKYEWSGDQEDFSSVVEVDLEYIIKELFK